MSTFEGFETAAGGRITAWVKGVPAEDAAREQLENVVGLPFVYFHLAVMPDVHFGRGATVGSVIPTKEAIIPAAVGVDIGCGMMAVETTLRAEHLPNSLTKLRSEIERKAPAGFGRNGEWGMIPDPVASRLRNSAPNERLDRIRETHRKIPNHKVGSQLGTLGSGNHFIEVCIDERGFVWVMLHSGLRGTGNQIGQYFIEAARQMLEKRVLDCRVPDQDLAFFVEGETMFDDHIEAVDWAQDYARANREAMMERALQAMREHLPKFKLGKHAVNCHHNYVEKEHYFGTDVWVTRKDTARAGDGELGIIPGSMGAKSFIVRGKGNPASFCSCSHGAGRAMSRTKAKETFTLKDHREATEGVKCRKDQGVIAAQSDLIEVMHTLKQVVCVKGSGRAPRGR